MYVCMCVCIYVTSHTLADRSDVSVSPDVCMYVCMYEGKLSLDSNHVSVSADVCIRACMYVCRCIHTFIHECMYTY